MEKSTQGEVVYEVKIDDSNLEKDLEQVNEKISSAVKKSGEEIVEATKETKKKIEKQTKNILENVEEKAEKAAEAWKDSGKRIEKEIYNIDELEIEINVDASSAEEEVKTAVGNIKDALKEIASEKVPLVGRVNELTEGLSGVKENALAATAAIAMESVGISDEMQSAMNRFLSVTGKSREETEKYQQVLENIYLNNYGENFEDISGAMAEVTRTIGDMDDASLQELTESALTLKTAFKLDVSESIENAKTLMDEYGMSGDEAMNFIAAGAQKGLESAEELFAALEEGFSTTGEELDVIKENEGSNPSSMFEELKRNIDLLSLTLGETLNPLLMTLIESIFPAVNEVLKPLIDLFAMLLIPIINLIGTAIAPLIDIFILLIGAAITPLIYIIQNFLVPIFTGSLQGLASSITEIMKNIKNIFINIIDFIKNVFTVNWRDVWEKIKNIFKNIVEGLGNLLKDPINFIIDAINGFISGVNKIKIPDWVPVVGGKGFHIPKIPRLKVGLDYVPSDFFPAFLDEGEAVLTKEENAIFRSLGGLEGMISLSRNQYPELLRFSSEAAPIIIHSHVELDGKEVGNSVTRYVDMNLSESGNLRRRGN